MTNPKLLEAGARVEETVKRLLASNELNEELMDLYLSAAISELDASFEAFEDGELEAYLMAYLETVRREQ